MGVVWVGAARVARVSPGMVGTRFRRIFCPKVAPYLISDSVASRLGHGSFIEQFFQTILRNKTTRGEFASKYQVLVATGSVFGDCEIMWIQA